MSIESQVNNEVVYGIIPMKKGERIYNFFDILLVTGGYAIATWCYYQGGHIATMVGLKEFLTSTFGIISLGGILLALIGIIGCRYGIDHWIYARAVFGYKGVFAILFLAIVPVWGWYAINAQMYGLSIWRILAEVGLPLSEGWVAYIALTCVIFGWWIAIRGPVAVKMATRIMVPSLFLVGVLILILVFSNASLSELSRMEPLYASSYDDLKTPYMLVNEWNLAFVFAWLPAIGVLTRLVKRERPACWGTWLGYSVIMAGFIVLGAFTGLLMGDMVGEVSTDPTEWLLHLGGPALGILSLIFIGVANITTMAIGLYSMSVSTKILKPVWSYRVVASIWAAWTGILVLWGGVWVYYETFIAIAGVICGPVIALIIADYFVVRRQKVSVRSLFSLKTGCYNFTGGFNIISAVAFVLGVISYFLTYDPITFMPKNQMFYYFTATGLATIVSFVSYVVLAYIPGLRSYVLPENKACGDIVTSKAN
ncbi:cytosine permease [Candidatus Contubernalis alkaliaceticus]|uniref:cytosine permease n=1 Tax=Candidatus Contubernalis alkaliaceticus TaxID=338645 RepID=UPI001F4BDF55|nr:cytosine permease [Candidatus Contubernalis alkalaceticus]UNC92208.1 cytosine permease [Candidatus Contubernalis alkalaceticus]